MTTYKRWKLETAKAHFSEVVRAAESGQPQLITRRGQPAAVVLPASQVTLKERNGWDTFSSAPKVPDFEPVRASRPGRDIPEL
ncbi:type II toxin-antitoxin system Phd/YefM family antitoxin [Deinococcus fonticola]|uniref:type II toxin-antitoxin system Phd/YefM family antitoxin n=1 Tax=Deinococcus fonticola TaxID=2528713 RepID=UPI001074B0BF|nr:type II toxin-antitoxin system prevent-host-death family antitoxin [Deinococcus fonticola]